MTRAVIMAVGGPAETQVMTALESTAGYAVVRRCADLAELLSSAAAGLADVALVSADLRTLDRAALSELAAHDVLVAGVCTRDDLSGQDRLRRLGLRVLTPDLDPPALDDALDALSSARRAGDVLSDEDGSPSSTLASAGPGAHRPVHDPAVPGSVRGEVVAVWGPAGAPGRSTIALNLAAELAGSATALLVDCDTYGASQAQALGLLDEAPGVAAAARAADQGALDVVALARLAPEVAPRFRVLTGLPRADRWSELRAAAVAQVLELSRDVARFVVVDCSFAIEDDEELSYDTLAPRRNAATLTALEAADQVVIVGSADPVGLQRLVRAIQDAGSVTSAPVRVVVNGVRASAVGSHPERRIAETLGRFAGTSELTFLPWDHLTLDEAMLAGVALVELAPQSDLRLAVAALAAAVAGQPPAGRADRRRRVRR